ncbi:MAG: protein alpha-tubulin suppressor [Acidimicrobiales bacterium]|nr:protein alpha-tubulin suppressor [Acidimicrobiales bacterium]
MIRWKITCALLATALVGGGAGIAVASSGGGGASGGQRQGASALGGRALGGSVTESKVVSIAPCRIVDTRLSSKRLPAGAFAAYKVRGTGGSFAAQGGKAGGCGIPSAATAVEATVSAVSPTGPGYLRTFPGGSKEPTATFLNYSGPNISNSGHIPICTAGCPANDDLTVTNYGHDTHLVIDVSGYAVKPLAVHVAFDASVIDGSRVTSVVRASPSSSGEYTVTFDRDVSQCAWAASVRFLRYSIALQSGGSPSSVTLLTLDGSAQSADAEFWLTVTC